MSDNEGLCGHVTGPLPCGVTDGNMYEIPCKPSEGTRGRYLIIQLQGEGQTLTLCEVEATRVKGTNKR